MAKEALRGEGRKTCRGHAAASAARARGFHGSKVPDAAIDQPSYCLQGAGGLPVQPALVLKTEAPSRTRAIWQLQETLQRCGC